MKKWIFKSRMDKVWQSGKPSLFLVPSNKKDIVCVCGTNIKAISCILSETLGARGLWSNEALSLTSEPSWSNTWPPWGGGGGGDGGSSRLGESDMMRVVKRNHSASNWFTCTFSCFRSTWHLSSKMSPCLWLSSLNIAVWYTLSLWKYSTIQLFLENVKSPKLTQLSHPLRCTVSAAVSVRQLSKPLCSKVGQKSLQKQ